jgi:catechol 2,3-dioxygenase-like lactoylglutathione lyase family enzyme
MIRRLAHICLMTNNLERQIAFYRDGLGLPIKFRFVNSEGELFGVYFDCGDTTFIEIFDKELAAKQWGGDGRPLQEGNRYNHLCLEVTEIAAVCETLRKRGVDIGPVSTGLDHSYQAWTADPDGNKLELMEYSHRSWQLQPGHDGK